MSGDFAGRKAEGVRIWIALCIGFAAGSMFFAGQCGFWPSNVTDRIAAFGVVVNVLFGAVTAITAYIAYRLGSRDAIDRQATKRNTSDIAAGLMYTAVVSLSHISEKAADLACRATRIDETAEKAVTFRHYAAGIRRFLDQIDSRHIAELAVCERELALTLSYTLGRVGLLPDLCEMEATRLEKGMPGTVKQREGIEGNAREFVALSAQFITFCERFSRTIRVVKKAVVTGDDEA